jgi:hypothetical protein
MESSVMESQSPLARYPQTLGKNPNLTQSVYCASKGMMG